MKICLENGARTLEDITNNVMTHTDQWCGYLCLHIHTRDLLILKHKPDVMHNTDAVMQSILKQYEGWVIYNGNTDLYILCTHMNAGDLIIMGRHILSHIFEHGCPQAELRILDMSEQAAKFVSLTHHAMCS